MCLSTLPSHHRYSSFHCSNNPAPTTPLCTPNGTCRASWHVPRLESSF
jgi:hypothetical protein